MKGDAFLMWLYALDKGYQDEREMEVLSDMTEGLRNFAAQYNYAINDPELIRRYRMVEDGKRDVATRISVAEERGEKIGEKRGEKRGEKIGAENAKREMAKVLKGSGIDSSIIAKTTGLSLEEIDRL